MKTKNISILIIFILLLSIYATSGLAMQNNKILNDIEIIGEGQIKHKSNHDPFNFYNQNYKPNNFGTLKNNNFGNYIRIISR